MIVEEQLLNGRGHKISPWNFKVSTIIPVWENYEISKILSRFTKPFEDEIIIIIDEASPNMRKTIKHGIKEAIPPVTVIDICLVTGWDVSLKVKVTVLLITEGLSGDISSMEQIVVPGDASPIWMTLPMTWWVDEDRLQY